MRKLVWGAVSLGAVAAGCVGDNGSGPSGFDLRGFGSGGVSTANAAGSMPEVEHVEEVPWIEWFFPKPDVKNPGRLNATYARLQEAAGNLVEAREYYESALRADPRSIDAVLGLARLDQLAGRHDDAERGFRKAARMRPEDPNVYDALGQFYASRERWAEAIDALHVAMSRAPENPTYRYHLGVALAQAGDFESALPHFAATVGEAEGHYNIGHILRERGDAAQAERQFEQALRVRPDLAEARRALDELRGTTDSQNLANRDAPPRPRIAAPPGWPRDAAPPAAAPGSYLAGYGQPQQDRFVPAGYPTLPELSAPVFAEDPRDAGGGPVRR